MSGGFYGQEISKEKDFCDQNGLGFLEIVLDNKKRDFTFGIHDRYRNLQVYKLVAE